MIAPATPPEHQGRAALAEYPLLSALHYRRSRRFGRGMRIEHGPLAYQSALPPLPLSEEEEALLAFAACGITGPALGELEYARGRGGGMLCGWVGRTFASADAIQNVALIISNDQATYLVRRPQDMTRAEAAELAELAAHGEYVEAYRRSRVKLQDGRVRAPIEPLYNFNINKWALYAEGGSYFLPVNDLTFLLINALLECFDEAMGGYIVDERNGFRPAGLARFARSKGGHLQDDPGANRVGTIQRIEMAIAETAALEQGMLLQNLGLMCQAMGLGGHAHFAAHEYGWLQALGFRMRRMPASRFLGAPRYAQVAARLLRKDRPVPYAVGLERDGRALITAYCPPTYRTMADAVRAVVAKKFGAEGTFRGGIGAGAWRDPQAVANGTPACSEAAVAATIAYCEYIYERYGRFPAYAPPFRTVLGYQAIHVDEGFYERFYRPEALSDTQRAHMAAWHGDPTPAAPHHEHV
jgi:hypothetical protein